MKVSIIVGSLRKGSFNRKLANALIALAPEELEMEILEISTLTMYNQDLDDSPPAEWENFRKKIKSSDGVLFVTPEYNRSYSGVIKNAIDIGSRPPGQGAWRQKPGGVISVTPGSLGGMAANQHLRLVLNAVGVPVLPHPETYVSGAANMFNDAGELTDESMRERMTKYLAAFAEWVKTNS